MKRTITLEHKTMWSTLFASLFLSSQNDVHHIQEFHYRIFLVGGGFADLCS